MWTWTFWKAALERAAKTAAQSLLAASGLGATDLLSVGWKQALTVALTAAVLSLLSSVASSRVGSPNSPSLVEEGRD